MVYFKHGQTHSGHYNRWRHMIDRCYDQKCDAFPNYGGRGISVYEDWHDIATFVRDLPIGYETGLELDRIDNDGNYEPGNIRWSTRSENTDNRRSGRKLTWNGKTQSVTRWSAELGIPIETIHGRLQQGWTIEKALTESIKDKDERMLIARTARWGGHVKATKPDPRVLKTFYFRGSDRTIAEISAITGINIKLLRKRICERGWSIAKSTEISP